MDSVRIVVEDRHLYKSKGRSISKMNTGRKADGFSDSKMIFSGKITSEYLYLICDGIGCGRQLFSFKKVYESEIKNSKK